MREDQFDVVYRLLDDDIVDSDDRRCGRVDDIEIEGGPGEAAYLAAILTGSGAWPNRLPRRLRGLATKVFSDRVRKVPWNRVWDIGETVELKDPGSKFAIGEADIWVGRMMRRLPGS